MSHNYRNERAFAKAQWAYDNMSPPEGPGECVACDGKGYMHDRDGEEIECEACEGFGWVTEDGEPFDPDQARRDADDYADWMRGDV